MFRPIKIRQYVAFMQSRGFSAAETLHGSGIDEQKLEDPGYLVDFSHYQSVVSNMIRLTGNQGIGLEVGAETEVTDFGIVGYAMMSSPTARDALNLWLRFSNALVGMMISLRLQEHDNGAWSLTASEIRPMGFLYNFGVEEIMSIAMKVGGILMRAPLTPSRLELSYPAPAHEELYRRHFGCEPRFNSRQTLIRFEAPGLSCALKGTDREFNAICLRHCSQILKQISIATPVAAHVRSLLLSRSHALPSLDAAAEALGMSPRSLRRHLMDEGQSFSALVNQFRIEIAKEYLGESRLSAKETAFALGFKDINAFRRAFKTWTGQTVHEFQEQVGHS